MQMLVDMPLGNGSTAVCDVGGLPGVTPGSTPNVTPVAGGGVPAQPLTFGPSQATADAMNDLSCRFSIQGTTDVACTLDANGNYNYRGVGTTVQFCGAMNFNISFASGDTHVAVQLVDVAGHIGDRRTLVVRVP